ncbi:MAG: FAD:protein FMN transferase [Bacteriovoracaceae bacterium]|nr:FAD:protein FMN transferase [Bacteriovoracaceae bacterium]
MHKCLILNIFILCSFSTQGATLQKTLFLMGSYLNLNAEAQKQQQLDEFYKSIGDELNFYERKISSWNPSSDVSRLNESSMEWIKVDNLVLKTIQKADECSVMTDQHFEPGLGSLVEMWGFRNEFSIPKKDDLKNRVHEIKLAQIEKRKNEIRKNSKVWKFDEGGIAKGFAIDLIKEKAQKFKIKNLRVFFSGQIYESDEQEVLIPSPINKKQIILSLKIKERSISTTNNFNQSYFKNGKRYGHIINPQTGMLYLADNSSLSVVHKSAALADCLSTGIFSLSKNKKIFKEWVLKHPEIDFMNLEVVKNKILITSSCGLSQKMKVLSPQIEIKNNCL